MNTGKDNLRRVFFWSVGRDSNWSQNKDLETEEGNLRSTNTCTSRIRKKIYIYPTNKVKSSEPQKYTKKQEKSAFQKVEVSQVNNPLLLLL